MSGDAAKPARREPQTIVTTLQQSNLDSTVPPQPGRLSWPARTRGRPSRDKAC